MCGRAMVTFAQSSHSTSMKKAQLNVSQKYVYDAASGLLRMRIKIALVSESLHGVRIDVLVVRVHLAST